jgi:opacity protein-like surface antigen
MTRSLVVLPALALISAASAAVAQTTPSPWELGLSGGVGPQFTGAFANRFPATLANHPEATGAGGQDIGLRGDTGTSVAAELTRTIGRKLGVQVVFTAAHAPLGGPSSDYAWTLDYSSRQPPNYTPQPLEVTGSTPWPRTGGELRELALAANLVYRYPVYERLLLVLSGGVAVQRFEGEISPLGVTLFSEGGHSTLSSETYRVRVAFGPNYAAGVDVGTEFAWRLSDRLGLALEVRYFAAQQVRVAPRVDRVLNNADVVDQTTPEALNAAAPLQRVAFDPSFGTALLGVRVRI